MIEKKLSEILIYLKKNPFIFKITNRLFVIITIKSKNIIFIKCIKNLIQTKINYIIFEYIKFDYKKNFGD